MTKSKKTPAPKPTKAASKKDAATTANAPKDAAAASPRPAAKPRERDPRLPAVGASINRVFKGRTYTLTFLDEGGVEVGGKVFSSLSAAARHVTGAASINGFLWAGLTGGATPPRTRGAKKSAPVDAKAASATANALATEEGQRAALAAAGIAKKGRPISKPRTHATAKPAKST